MHIKKIVVGEIKTNCYIISKGDKCFVIDPGDEFNKIIKETQKYELQFILLTHGHFDHVLAIEKIREIHRKVPVYISGEDEYLLRCLSEQNPYSSKELKDFKFAIKRINENTTLSFCGDKINIIETPGHSQGSLCYLINDNLFSGDTLFYRTIGRTDFWTSNHDDMIKSLKKLAALSENTKVYPGHGCMTTISEELTNGYLGKVRFDKTNC